MNIDAYLKRINYSGSLEPTAETLRALQVAHLLAVPFENLSIHAGEPIVLKENALFSKDRRTQARWFLLRSQRFVCGACCGLWVLKWRCWQPAWQRKRVVSDHDFDHMTLMVTLAERWLVDVGFGDSFLEPLLLDSRDEQVQGTRAFRIVDDNDHLILMRRNHGGDWEPQYRFTLQPHTFADYEEMCHLPSDFSRLTLHQRPHLLAAQRKTAASRSATCASLPPPVHNNAARTNPREPGRIRPHPARPVRHRDERGQIRMIWQKLL